MTIEGNCWKKIVLALALVLAGLTAQAATHVETAQAHCYNSGYGAGGTKWC